MNNMRRRRRGVNDEEALEVRRNVDLLDVQRSYNPSIDRIF
jgi:hypothetical protein